MAELADLISTGVLQPEIETPLVMMGTVLDVSPLRVVVPSIDGGKHAINAFGTFPDAAPGDEVRVTVDEFDGLTVIAWEAA